MTTTTDSCTCDICVGYCKRNPGWGTPADIVKLIDLGHGDQLMLDWWNEDGVLPRIEVLCPASRGHEGRDAPDMPFMGALMDWSKGRCVFLTAENRCSIYGDRPTECEVARHDKVGSINRDMAVSWNTDEGRAMVARWKAEHQQQETAP